MSYIYIKKRRKNRENEWCHVTIIFWRLKLVFGSSNCNLSFLFSPNQIHNILHTQRKKQKKNVCKFLELEPNSKNQSIDHYPMKAIILSASATARTTIFHYDVQFGRFCTNKHKGRCFLSVHSSSPSKLSPKQNHKVKLVFLTKAADSSRAASSTTGSKTIVTDDEFSLAKVFLFLLLLFLCGIDFSSLNFVVKI